MKSFELDIVMAQSVRRSLVESGDIVGDVQFQNDINSLLARLDEKVPPLAALAWMTSPPVEARPRAGRRRAVAQRVLRVLDGGGAGTPTIPVSATPPVTVTAVDTEAEADATGTGTATTATATSAVGGKVLMEWAPAAAVRQG